MGQNNLSAESLSILLWNANGVLQRFNELEYFLHAKRIDIALITETHLTSRARFLMRGYSVIRADHPLDRSQGGSLILIRSTITHHIHPIEPPTMYLQAAAISVSLKNSSVTVASVYSPPRFRITSDQFSQFFTSLGTTFIAGGDYNSKHIQWGSRITQPRGRALLKAVSELAQNSHILAPTSPTYWPTAATKLPDIIDVFITRGINIHHTKLENFLNDLSSDHSPLFLSLNTTPVLRPPRPSLTPGDTNWEHFRSILQQNINLKLPLKTPLELEAAVEHFTKQIQNAAWNATTPRKYTRQYGPVYPQYIKELIQEKRRARGRWQRSRLREDKIILNQLTNRLQKNMKEFKQEQFSRYLHSLESPDEVWRATKRILKHPTPSHPLRRDDLSWAKSDQERADEFSEHLSKSFTPHEDVEDPDFTMTVQDFISSPLPLSFPPPWITPAEVKSGISRLPLQKSPGYDLITSEILRELPNCGIALLTQLYNSIIRLTHFPIQWKMSEIILIHKPGKPTDSPSSYRPISLLSIPSKLFERLFLNRLLPILEENNVIPSHQFGFRKRHSTTQQLHRVTDFIAAGLENKHYTGGVLLDIASAFDRVWHDGLLYKLKHLLSDSLYRVCKSFLEDRYFRVRVGSCYSDYKEIQAGVPQGSILSPHFYNIYTSDIPQINETLLATFADDTNILSSTPTPENTSLQLQTHLNSIESWLQRWRLKVNTTKSTHITFTLRKNDCPPVFLNNTEIPRAQTVRYLGLIFDRRLTWKNHCKSKRLFLNNRLKLLYRLLNKTSKIPLKNKLLLYKTILKPIWTYGIQIFGSAKHSNLRKLQTFQSKILRVITACPYYVSNLTLHNDLRIPFIQDVAKDFYKRFNKKLINHQNPFVCSLASRTLPGNPRRRLKRRWSRDLLELDQEN